MYVGRDLPELTMTPKTDWRDSELAFFHENMKQLAAYLNAEGVSMHSQIIKEIERRGGLHRDADWTHGTRVYYD